MKTKILILITVLFATVTSCTKKDTSPTSRITTPPPASSTTNTTTPSGAESVLAGHWVFDSIVFYSNGIETSSVLPNANHNNFVYDLTSAAYGSGSIYAGDMSMTYETVGNTTFATFWKVSDQYLSTFGYLFLKSDAPYIGDNYIFTLTCNQLIITPSTSTVKQGEYYYFHK